MTFDGEMLQQAQNTILLGGLLGGLPAGVVAVLAAGNFQTDYIAEKNIHVADFPRAFLEQAEGLEQAAPNAL